MESAELKNQRLKEVFQTKIQEFRKVCYTLTGYQIDVTTESQYRLTSQYAEHKTDCLIFKVGLCSATAAHHPPAGTATATGLPTLLVGREIKPLALVNSTRKPPCLVYPQRGLQGRRGHAGHFLFSLEFIGPRPLPHDSSASDLAPSFLCVYPVRVRGPEGHEFIQTQ